MPTRATTTAAFVRALKTTTAPSAAMRRLLCAHVNAPNHVSNMRTLAKAAKYKSWRAANLQYGLLARRIGDELRIKGLRIGLLVEFVGPKKLSNSEWLVMMRPTFARALKRAGWV